MNKLYNNLYKLNKILCKKLQQIIGLIEKINFLDF